MTGKRQWIVMLVAGFLLPWSIFTCPAITSEVRTARFEAADTLDAEPGKNPKAQALLDAVSWEPGPFVVECTSTPGQTYDALVRFDSPRPSGIKQLDRVVLMWYAARGEDGEAIEAPAVLLVHSLQPQMIIAQQIAKRFADQGLHAFILQLPGYGERVQGPRNVKGNNPGGNLGGNPGNNPGVTALVHGRQAVADCRRARDAIAVLPNIKPGPIALQGTSLGGFFAATAGSIDRAFDPVVLLISGADGYRALQTGQHDARYLKLALNRLGYKGDALRTLIEPVDPLHVAHRLDPSRTWLISARDDLTIPRACSDALVKAIGLDDGHRLWLSTNHYTTLLILPGVSKHMADLIHSPPDRPTDD